MNADRHALGLRVRAYQRVLSAAHVSQSSKEDGLYYMQRTANEID